MIRWMMILAMLAGTGCGSSGVDVNVTSDDDDVFRAPEAFDDEKAAARADKDGQPRRRAPFITLGAYDWDYDVFLNDLSHAVADLELPRSAETRVLMRFRAEAAKPVIELECETTPVECADLRNRLDSWMGWPRLPAACPHGELEVVLSNLP